MDVRHLRYFVAVVEQGSFTRAAERLHIAQPAVGAHIKQLEDRFGLRLLVRHSRGIEPTPEGREFYRQALELLRGIDALDQQMRDLSDTPHGRVVVGMTPSLRNLLSPQFLDICARELPQVQISLAEGLSSMLVEWLAADRIDLALLYDLPENHRSVRGEVLTREALYFVDHPRHGRGRADGTIAFAELCEAPLAMPALRSEVLRQKLEETASAQGRSLKVAYEVESMSVVRELVLSGKSATALPYGALMPDIEAGRLRGLRIVEPEIPRVLFFCYSDKVGLNRAKAGVRDIVLRLTRALPELRPEIWSHAQKRPADRQDRRRRLQRA